MEYFGIYIFIVFGSGLSILLFFIAYFLNVRTYEVEKLSVYECGFDPFDDSRDCFDVRFYLVAILFVIFDLEIIYLFPWAIVLNRLDIFGYTTMMCFIGILILGFAYEWSLGALEW